MLGLWIETKKKTLLLVGFEWVELEEKKMQLLKYHGKRISIMFVFIKNFEKKKHC